MPASAAEAVDSFGDGAGVTVFAGGTILMPEVSYGRYPRGGRTLMLQRAGLDGIDGDGTITIGAMVTLSAIASSGLEPLAPAAADIADPEIRAQATVGGNLCAPPGRETPRGDLQAPLLAVGARVRSAGPGGERTESVLILPPGCGGPPYPGFRCAPQPRVPRPAPSPRRGERR